MGAPLSPPKPPPARQRWLGPHFYFDLIRLARKGGGFAGYNTFDQGERIDAYISELRWMNPSNSEGATWSSRCG